MATTDRIHGLLTPDTCVVTLIDHQPQMLFGVNSIDCQTVINHTIGLAKTAKAFNVPMVLSTVETKSFSGYLWPQLRPVYPDQELIEGIVKLIGHEGVAFTPPHENSLTAIFVGTSVLVQLPPRMAYLPRWR